MFDGHDCSTSSVCLPNICSYTYVAVRIDDQEQTFRIIISSRDFPTVRIKIQFTLSQERNNIPLYLDKKQKLWFVIFTIDRSTKGARDAQLFPLAKFL